MPFRMRSGITLIEGGIAAALVLALAVPMLLGVLDTRRRSRDTLRVAAARQAQAAVEAYRARTASYPATTDALRSDDADLARALRYEARPSGCEAERGVRCDDYLLTFTLEGALGALSGGTCTARPRELSCAH